jgi:hypothetical protein
MNRIRAAAPSADKLRTVTAIARELQPLPIDETLFQTNAHQSTVVRNAMERTELVRAYIVFRSKMTAEMHETLSAAWAKEALPVEPGVNLRD